MSWRRAPSGEKPKPDKAPGTIDLLGEAFALLGQRPHLILLPIVLDLFLWLGVGMPATAFTAHIGGWLHRFPSVDIRLIDDITGVGKSYNVIGLLGISTPSLMEHVSRGALSTPVNRLLLTGLPWWSIPVLGLIIAAIGLALGMLYLTILKYVAYRQAIPVRLLWRQTWINTRRMLGFVCAAALAVVLLMLPLVLFGSILLIVGINALPFVIFLMSLGVFWAFLMLFFAQYAIVDSSAGVFRAAYLSYNVTRRNPWSTAGFIIVYFIMVDGMPVALHVLLSSAWGVLLAMIVNAYVASGTLIAAMLFYRERARRLPGVTPGPVEAA